MTQAFCGSIGRLPQQLPALRVHATHAVKIGKVHQRRNEKRRGIDGYIKDAQDLVALITPDVVSYTSSGASNSRGALYRQRPH